MSYIGKKPTPAPLTSSDITNGIVTGEKLNADVISSQTELATAPADTDEFLISDAGVLKRLDASLVGGGGKILQVVSAADTTQRSTTSTSFNTMSSTLTLDITPSATSSKILVMLSTGIYLTANDAAITIYRDSTNLGHSSFGIYYAHYLSAFAMATINYMDSPNTTSQVTYTMYARNVSGSSTLNINNETDRGSLIAMEIGA